jgi:hypothetical protein
VISHCCFDQHFSWPFVCLLCRNVYSSSLLISLDFFFIFCYWSLGTTCNLGISPWLNIWLANIFPTCRLPLLCWLYPLLWRAFVVWCRPLVQLCILACAVGVLAWELLPITTRVLPVFSTKSPFSFRPYIWTFYPVWLDFVHDVK